MKNLFIFLSISLIFFSCKEPLTKDSYLKGYDQFIVDISNNCSSYTVEDWKEKDLMFKNYDDKWYNKFKEDFTWEEKIKLAKYNLQYVYYRNKPGAISFFDKYLNKGIEGLKEKIKYYKDHQMDADLEKLKEASQEAGDSATLIFQRAMNEVH